MIIFVPRGYVDKYIDIGGIRQIMGVVNIRMAILVLGIRREGAMGRELVNEKALQSHLESELHRHQECNRYRVTSVTKLQSPDAEGCNWVPTITTESGSRNVRDPCVEIAERIVAEARKKFNLA